MRHFLITTVLHAMLLLQIPLTYGIKTSIDFKPSRSNTAIIDKQTTLQVGKKSINTKRGINSSTQSAQNDRSTSERLSSSEKTEKIDSTTALVSKNNESVKIDRRGQFSKSKRFNVPVVTRVLAVNFLVILANVLTLFVPAPYLIEKVGSSKATSILTSITTLAAIIEISFSRYIGSIIDRHGRRPTLLACISLLTLSSSSLSKLNANVSIYAICFAKIISMVSSSFLTLVMSAIISDLHLGKSAQELSSTLGLQMSFGSSAFLVGTLLSGQLSSLKSNGGGLEESLKISFSVSSLLNICTTIFVYFSIQETLPSSSSPHRQEINSKEMTGESSEKHEKTTITSSVTTVFTSWVRLLVNNGKLIRILGILMLLDSLPMNMGFIFQIVSFNEWGLSAKQFSSFIAFHSVIGILSNIFAASVLIKKLPQKTYLLLTMISRTFPPLLTTLFGFKGVIWGSIFGFLQNGQYLALRSALMKEGMKQQIPQGMLAGELASLMGILKVFGPLWFGILFKKGKELTGSSSLPFVFNFMAAIVSLVICQAYL